jgi:hypothetical protein
VPARQNYSLDGYFRAEGPIEVGDRVVAMRKNKVRRATEISRRPMGFALRVSTRPSGTFVVVRSFQVGKTGDLSEVRELIRQALEDGPADVPGAVALEAAL